jgi:hypothetical protein
LVQWLLAIPHLIIVWVLGYVSGAVAVISWFAILITGKLPAGLAGLQQMYLRYYERTYVYAGFLVDAYPPFGFDTTSADPGDHEGVKVDFASALEGRNRLTTFFRLILVIPHLVVLAVLTFAAHLAWIVAFFAVLFTGKWPGGLQTFVVGVLQWGLRVEAYFLLLTDKYPPFSLD